MLEKEMICLDIEGNNKLDIIDKLISIAYKNNHLNNVEAYKEAVLRREQEFSTALGFQVAMPHGQSDGVNEPFVVFGRCRKPILWDDNEVMLIFMIGVPMKNREETHMKLLANISRKLVNETFRDNLLNASSIEEVHDILSTI